MEEEEQEKDEEGRKRKRKMKRTGKKGRKRKRKEETLNNLTGNYIPLLAVRQGGETQILVGVKNKNIIVA